MSAYPVHYQVIRPDHFTRLQLAVRVLAFLVIGLAGLSFGSVFLLGFLGLPLIAAIRMSRDRASYYRDDAPMIVVALRWFAAFCGWTGLVIEAMPQSAPEEKVSVEVAIASQATAGGALWRVVTGLPSAIVFAILLWIGGLVWLWAALSILIAGRVGPHAFAYLVGLQRWSIRLLAYQACLVDEYPPFSFSEPEEEVVACAS